MKARELKQEPITPAVDGRPPAFVVACLDCEYTADAHGATPEAAIQSVAERHHRGHRLMAKAVDYTQHPLYTT